MAAIIIIENAREIRVEAQEGKTLMEIIRDTGDTELLALCGGCCSCGTCHVFVDADRFDILAPIAPDEEELLDVSANRRPNSRLSCQIPFSDALDGLRVEIAPPG